MTDLCKNLLSIKEGQQREFTLHSGNKASFIRVKIPHDKIQEVTFINQKTNVRDQHSLTEESLSDIIKTIKFQQFFPVIGREVDGKIEILDGTRRRASAIYAGSELEVLYSKDYISTLDARKLASEIQTAKEHSIRELGIGLNFLKVSGLSYKDIAQKENLSRAKVTRAFQAASVPQEIIALFPIASELNFNDYKTLFDYYKSLEKSKEPFSSALSKLKEEIKGISVELPSDIYKKEILNIIKKNKKKKIDTSVTIDALFISEDKRTYIKRKENKANRTLTFTLSKINKKVQKEIDEAIKEIVSRNLSI
ncbi:TPA: ParB/RepB/Spo0J family partition protein [Escherichia coli]|uniref:ParB/RepB/Spo0J family partition protein n=1 Tax=Escherichia coli TaxID=562 RepID=UPI000E1D213F|nr:ParB/RepB/Spo0J family partition protein [Escherichia coli]RDQ03952.1 Virulence regulon transcriptional activator VirB [Escherichia coli]RDQ54400.1 Virulence regulon transcriptional activator VirB [Escherichia coli]